MFSDISPEARTVKRSQHTAGRRNEMSVTHDAPKDEAKRSFLVYFLGGSFLAWLGAILYPVIAYLSPPKQSGVAVTSVKAGRLEDIPLDSGQIVKFGSKPVIMVRTRQGDVKAFEGTCTHLDCTVQYKKDEGIIWCACHNGQYDLTGRNIGGPPPKPLEEYRVVVKADEILISKTV